ncbi:DJ-1/PfpI family protein [Nocardia huaxiensis]|uniref:DJ-1/PfpI family protein n=1 Tax=Nocardia huaxiensis TaxID=2755382 RepID=A0A7D6VI31_9NOCA|nr:DJ-1/PfpI family protein [Nocardia huaxiensis]QLY30110.1 DJ-1/PfpI family protein [Nocardia huaxiensis]
MADRTRKIGVLLFPGVEELDFTGPWEVLAFWTLTCPQDGWEIFTFSRDGLPLQCAKGLRVTPDYSFGTVPDMDVLLFPGGLGTRPLVHDESMLAWLQAERPRIPLITSVCTGALVLAAAGLLANRPATTHWLSLDVLAHLDPTIDIRPHDRFVDSGDIITSAGVSAGIDMSLHLLQRLAGTDRARWVRRGIQYDPEPPADTAWPEGQEWIPSSSEPRN